MEPALPAGPHHIDQTRAERRVSLTYVLNSTRFLLPPLLAVLVTACSSLVVGDVPVETTPSGDGPGTTGTTSTTKPDLGPCAPTHGSTTPVATGAVATDALHLSGEMFVCSHQVVVTDPSNLDYVAAAAQLAAAVDGPLLFPHPQLAAEVGRLTPRIVHMVGTIDLTLPLDVEVLVHQPFEAVEHVRELLGVTLEVTLPADPDSSTVVETVGAITHGDRVAVPQLAVPGASPASIDPEEVVAGLADLAGSGTIWMVEADDPVTILLAAAMGQNTGASVVAADFDELLRYPELGAALDGYPDRTIRLVGVSTELDDWEMRVLVRGEQLPGGGFELFPEHINRRFLAFYGHPGSPSLGAMGQLSPDQVLEYMRTGGELTGYLQTGCLPSPCRGLVSPGLLEGYAADGAHVVPTFNYIASSAQPGCRTHKFPMDTFEDGIRTAAERGGYVVFDIQPGHDDFLSHAQFYEEALRLPHVGLAIDPEWRCGWPDQSEFNRIGTVAAAEINAVIEWLADLVNEEGLPQKLLLIQQFRLDMIQDREDLLDRREVQVVIQMDGEGQGNLATKEATWNRVTEGTEDDHVMWGWKNFFVRDHPNGPYPPDVVLDRDPVPVYISYQ